MAPLLSNSQGRDKCRRGPPLKAPLDLPLRRSGCREGLSSKGMSSADLYRRLAAPPALVRLKRLPGTPSNANQEQRLTLRWHPWEHSHHV